MSRFVKFIILAVIGFGLGAGLAWIQSGNQSPAVPEVAAVAAPEEGADVAAAVEMGTEEIVPDAPEMPTAEGMMDMDGAAAAGVPAEAATETTPDAATEAATKATPEAKTDAHAHHHGHDHAAAPAATDTPVVAGSTVGGAFTLTDHNGAEVTEKSWPGKKKLVFFGFTHCPDICPVALDKMTVALNALGDAAAQVQPIFITTDPARDTPAVMKEFIANYHPALVGLTGSEEQIKAARDAYKVYAAKVPGSDDAHYLMDHSGYVYLMSEDDQMLEIFGSSSTAETIVEQSRKHLAN